MQGTMMNLKDRILDGMDLSRRIVEIGPLYRPFVRKSEGNVVYVDHADTETLREKYKADPKFSMSDIVDVDAVWGDKTLSECVGGRVDYIIASHVIEHVPDLFGWLNELSAALTSGGQIRLVVPDKRFTFDYLRRTTQFADVLDAHIRKTRVPLPHCVLDHVLNVRNVDVGASWNGPLDALALTRPPGHGYQLAVDTANKALSGEYHDVHCWVFTPKSFAGLMRQAVTHGLVAAKCAQFSDTAPMTLEFTVFAEPCADAEEASASWAAMEEACFDQPNPEIVMLAGELESVRVELSAATQESERRRAEADHLAAELQAAQTTLEEIRQSTSWRVTAPLRRAVAAVRSAGFPASRRHGKPRHKSG